MLNTYYGSAGIMLRYNRAYTSLSSINMISKLQKIIMLWEGQNTLLCKARYSVHDVRQTDSPTMLPWNQFLTGISADSKVNPLPDPHVVSGTQHGFAWEQGSKLLCAENKIKYDVCHQAIKRQPRWPGRARKTPKRKGDLSSLESI